LTYFSSIEADSLVRCAISITKTKEMARNLSDDECRKVKFNLKNSGR